MFEATKKQKKHAQLLGLDEDSYVRYISRMSGFFKNCKVITPQTITNAMFIHKELIERMVNDGINPSDYIVRHKTIKSHLAYIVKKRTAEGLGALRISNDFKQDFGAEMKLPKSALDKFFRENKLEKGIKNG